MLATPGNFRKPIAIFMTSCGLVGSALKHRPCPQLVHLSWSSRVSPKGMASLRATDQETTALLAIGTGLSEKLAQAVTSAGTAAGMSDS
jgi:hypothetical protein